MKVLHVISRMNVGGTATYLSNLIDAMDKSGIETLLAFGAVPSNEIEDNRVTKLNSVRIRKLSRAISLLKDAWAFYEIHSLIRKYKPDIVHSHTFKAGFLVRAKKLTIPTVHTFHGHHLYDPDYGYFGKLILNAIEKVLALRTSKIVTVGAKISEELLAAGIGCPGQYKSIPPGISFPTLLNKTAIIEKFRLRKGALNVLWMGRITNVKRPDRVLEIAIKFPHINFLIAGDGELKAGLEKRSLSNTYFLGTQNSSEMLTLADVAILTSDSEGMPLTLIECQMAGVPVVSTSVGSIPEIVQNGETGYTTSTDVNELSSSLKLLLDNDTLRVSMGKKATELSRYKFSIEQMVKSHIDLYRDILKEDKT